MLTTRNALLAAGAAVLVAVAGDRAASASDWNWAWDGNGNGPWDSVSGGIDSNGATLYFCKAWMWSGYQPGKVNKGLGTCNFAYGGVEEKSDTYFVMEPHWEWSSDGGVSASPFQGGRDTDFQPLYVCRAYYQGGLHPGKLKSGVGCYIPYGGNEILLNNYQVLQDDLPMTTDYNNYRNFSWLDIRGGYEANPDFNNWNSYLLLCVATNLDGSTQPGKYSFVDHTCHFSYAGVEVLSDDFRFVFLRTRPFGESQLFDFVVGQDTNGEPLYACTAHIAGDNDASTQLGKYRQDFDDGCHVPWGGQELFDVGASLVD